MDATEYLDILKIALAELRASVRTYELAPDDRCSRLKVTYHVFSYTQAFYALREKLVKDKVITPDIVRSFFEAARATKIVNRYANDMKHDYNNGIEVNMNFHVGGEKDGKITPILPSRYNPDRISAEVLMENSFEEIKRFMFENGYRYQTRCP